MSMRWFPVKALNDGVRPREVVAWSMYDFANSGYTTVVITAVFNAYFVGVVAAGAEWGTLLWTLLLGVSNALVMLTMPLIGAHADINRNKKRWLLYSTTGCILSTSALAAAGPGDWWWAGVGIVLSNLFFSWGESLIAAFLPELARPEALGRVSGWGWSLGYLGGMVALGLSLAHVLAAQAAGQTASQFVPVTMIITASVYALAAMWTFIGLRERGGEAPYRAVPFQWGSVGRILRDARAHPDFLWLMGCSAAYQAGVSVVIALAAVYAEQAMGFIQTDTMLLIFLVNIAAAGGAFGFGYLQDSIGHKRTLALTLVGWLLMIGMAYAAESPDVFWMAAVLAGICMGSSQSAGRAMAAVLAPAQQSGEFFGLWTVSTRLAAILGPITYGVVTWVTGGNHRLGILTTGLFFVVGLALLVPLRMPNRQNA